MVNDQGLWRFDNILLVMGPCKLEIPQFAQCMVKYRTGDFNR